MTRALLVLLAWLCAVAAIIGGLFEFGTTWFAAWGLVMAIALTGWSLIAYLDCRRDEVDGLRTYRDDVWARRDAEQDDGYDLDAWPGVLLHRADGLTDDEDELPFRGPVRTDLVYRTPTAWQHVEGGKRAMWPSELGGIE